MRARELRDLTDEARENRLAETRQGLSNLRSQSGAGALEDPARLKHAKREIARILPIRIERESSLTRETNA